MMKCVSCWTEIKIKQVYLCITFWQKGTGHFTKFPQQHKLSVSDPDSDLMDHDKGIDLFLSIVNFGIRSLKPQVLTLALFEQPKHVLTY